MTTYPELRCTYIAPIGRGGRCRNRAWFWFSPGSGYCRKHTAEYVREYEARNPGLVLYLRAREALDGL